MLPYSTRGGALRGAGVVRIVNMNIRNNQLRSAIDKAYIAAAPEVRAEVDRIAAALAASLHDQTKIHAAIYANLCERARALIAGGADPELFADHL